MSLVSFTNWMMLRADLGFRDCDGRFLGLAISCSYGLCGKIKRYRICSRYLISEYGLDETVIIKDLFHGFPFPPVFSFM